MLCSLALVNVVCDIPLPSALCPLPFALCPLPFPDLLLKAYLFQGLYEPLLRYVRRRCPAADSSTQHIVERAVDDLLVVAHRFEDVFRRQITNWWERSELHDRTAERFPVCRRHDTARDGNLRRDQHAVRNRLSVAEALVFRHRFERVTGRVAEVQHPPRT